MRRIVDVLPQFEREAPTLRIGPETCDRYVRILAAFAHWLDPEASPSDFDEGLVRSYQAELAQRGRAKRTIRLTLSAIRAFSRWAMRAGLRADDPTLGVTWPKIPKTRGRALRLAELRQLVVLMSGPMPRRRGFSRWQWERNIRVFQLIIYAGLRISEVCRLDWEDVELDLRTLLVRGGKGEKDRLLPLHQQLVATLAQVPPAARRGAVIPSERGRGNMTPEGADKIFSRWLPALGIDGLTAHRLRHTCATLMRHFGADTSDIKEILGHESLETTQGYLGPDPERLQAAIDVLPAWGELGTYQPPQLRVVRGQRGRAYRLG